MNEVTYWHRQRVCFLKSPLSHPASLHRAVAFSSPSFIYVAFFTHKCWLHNNDHYMNLFVQVELELSLDPNSATYCLARGEQIAYVVDESASSKDKEPYYPR